MVTDLVEREDTKFGLQLKDFSDGIAGSVGTALGFSPAEKTEAQNDAAYVLFINERQGKVQDFSEAFTQYKNELRFGSETPITEPVLDVPLAPPTAVTEGVEKRFRQKAAKAKNSGAYTTAIGQSLHIEAPVTVFDPLTSKPEFKIALDAGRPQLKFKKAGYEGQEVWKDSGSGYVKLGRITRTPWVDETPLPAAGQSAVWKFKLIGVINDKVVGNFSDEVTITVHGEV